MSLDIVLILAVVALAAAVIYLLMRRKQVAAQADVQEKKRRGVEDLDPVVAWPPEATRLLTGGERAAHELLLKALPECMIFAQVPLARFLKVPRRHSYTDWLTRVGHLSADLVICDRSTLVIGVVMLQSDRESERGVRRRALMARVLKAAGVKAFTWREVALPSSASVARDQLMQRLGDVDEAKPDLEATSPHPPRGGNHKIPVPEVLVHSDDDSPRREPPASTWFDDLDSGRVPLDPSRRPPGP